MSARDAESGSSSYKGGSGRAGGLGNGGIGGGMGGGGNWGGGWGGGAGRMGGMGNRTGMMTGNMMYGGMAMGRPGGMAMNPGAWGQRPQAPVQQGPMGQPPGLLGNPTPTAVPGVNPIPEMPQYAPPAWSPPYAKMPVTQAQIPQFFGAPQTYYMADRIKMPNAFDMAVQKPSYETDWPGQYSVSGYNDPSLGTPRLEAAIPASWGKYSTYNQGSADGGKGSLPKGVRY